MSDTYSSQQTGGFGGSLVDLVSTQKGGFQTVSKAVQGLTNAFPVATASSSPNATGFTLGSTAVSLVAANPNRHGILFCAPGTTAGAFVFPSNMSPAPSLTTTGGALFIATTVMLPSSLFPNINCGFSGFAGTSSGTVPFTVWEFL